MTILLERPVPAQAGGKCSCTGRYDNPNCGCLCRGCTGQQRCTFSAVGSSSYCVNCKI